MAYELWQLGVLLVVGFIAGFMNVMAGGGSLLTLPAMVLILGYGGPEANGTNRVALLAQNISSSIAFYRKGFSDIKLSLSLALCSLPSAISGAFMGLLFDGIWFNRFLAILMVLIMTTNLLKRTQLIPSKHAATRNQIIAAHIGMFFTGFYGGFIQAGTGLVMIPVLQHTLRLELVRVNMHKVFIIGLYTLFVLIIFAFYGKVFWISGITLALGSAIGGLLSTHVAIKKGEPFIRFIFNMALIAMAIKLLIS